MRGATRPHRKTTFAINSSARPNLPLAAIVLGRRFSARETLNLIEQKLAAGLA